MIRCKYFFVEKGFIAHNIWDSLNVVIGSAGFIITCKVLTCNANERMCNVGDNIRMKC